MGVAGGYRYRCEIGEAAFKWISDIAPPKLHVGARVQHRSFSLGVIQPVGAGPDSIVTVKFSGYSLRSLKGELPRAGGG